jgi:ABC-type transport system involved in multi-copper enzyme maturation permease subunit
MLLFGLFLPFVTTDGVARDLNRRTHELLMASALPTGAYMWGRYLAGIVLSLSMADLLLLAIATIGVAEHLAQPGTYPALDMPGALAIWAIIVLPATVLLASLSFALGTMLPRRSNLVKTGVLLGWFICGVLLSQFMLHQVQAQTQSDGLSLPWYAAYIVWDPTSSLIGGALRSQFYHRLGATLRNPALSNQAFLTQVLHVVKQAPDLGAFLGPHLAWIGISLSCVVVAALAFKRFRGALG